MATLAIAAPGAVAAEPTSENCTPRAGASTAELQAQLASPTLREYCPPGSVEGVKNAINNNNNNTGGGGGVAAEQDDTTAEVGGSGNLPFTGAEIGTFLGLGGALILTGLVLRRSGGRENEVL